MPFRQNPFGELKVPLTWTAGVGVVVAGVIAVGLLLSDRRDSFETYGAVRQSVDKVTAPVGGVISTPVRWIGGGFSSIGDYFAAGSQNHRLRTELAEARAWQDKAAALADENGRLRAVLGIKTDPPMPMAAARILNDVRGPYANTRLASAGADQGVAIGYPVLSERGLIGRVIGVAPTASRVMLLTDVAAKTPVMIARSNARAILTGDGGPNPKLENLRGVDPAKEGDRVLTSGDGGVLPRGLPVGRVVKGLDGRWRVVLDSDSAPIDWVRILKFRDYAQLADQKALAASVMPAVITEDPQARMVPAAPKPAAPAAPATGTTTAPPPAAAPKPAASAATPAAATPPARTPAPKPATANRSSTTPTGTSAQRTPSTATSPGRAPAASTARPPAQRAPAATSSTQPAATRTQTARPPAQRAPTTSRAPSPNPDNHGAGQ